MTTYAGWKSDVNGNWDTKADWDGGFIPGADTGVYLGPSSTPYTVTSNHSDSAYGLNINAGAKLNVTSGVFTDENYFASAGTVAIQSGAEFDVGVAGNNQGYGNSGVIDLLGGTLRILDNGVGLNSGGTILMSNSANNLITGGSASQTSVLDNVKQTIKGAGSIAGQFLQFVNSRMGVVDASAATALKINVSSEIDNAGLMESTSAGGLVITGSVRNEGELKSTAGTLTVTGNADGNGILDVAKAGKIEVGGGVANDVYFETGSTGTLILDHGSTSQPPDEIYGATSGVHFDLRDVLNNSASHPTFTLSGGLNEYTLTVTDGAHSVNLYLAGGLNAYNSSSFTLHTDGKGGTLVTVV